MSAHLKLAQHSRWFGTCDVCNKWFTHFHKSTSKFSSSSKWTCPGCKKKAKDKVKEVLV